MIIIAPSVKFDHPVIMNGSGTVIIKDEVSLGYFLSGAYGQPIVLQARGSGTIAIGAKTTLANGVEIFAVESVVIGENCKIGRCMIMDTDFHEKHPDMRDKHSSRPTKIGNNVFIGTGVIILKGVNIGDNSVIGAGCVVSKDVPANTVYAGKVLGSVYDST